MSYLVMRGKLVNTLSTPKGVTKGGEAFGGRDQIQLLCTELLKNEEDRLVLQTLNLPPGQDLAPFEKLVGQDVTLPVSPYVMAGKLGYSLGIMAKPSAGKPPETAR